MQGDQYINKYNQMSYERELALNSLVSEHQTTLQLMHNHAIAKSHKVARHVYNLQSRNIAQFIKQDLEFRRKANQQQAFKFNNKLPPKLKRFGVTLRYQENQTLQLSFDSQNNSQRGQRKPPVLGQSHNSATDSISRLSTFKTSHKSFLRSGNLEKLTYNIKGKLQGGVVQNRKKTLSFSNPRVNVISNNRGRTNSIQKQSNRGRNVTQFEISSPQQEESNMSQKAQKVESYGNNEPLIALTKQKMARFIKNLHKIAYMSKFLLGKAQNAEKSEQFKEFMKNFHFDPYLPISESHLNYMVSRRYGLLVYTLQDHYDKKRKLLDNQLDSVSRQRLGRFDDYSLLHNLSKESIFKLMKKNIEGKAMRVNTEPIAEQAREQKVRFSLPFAEFISQRQTKASIYRLVRMSEVGFLRLAFSLYDKNHNGLIDQDDMLQALSLSRKMPQLQADLIILASSLIPAKRIGLKKPQKSTSQRESNDRSDKGSNVLSRMVQPIAEQEVGQQQEDLENGNPSSNRFSIQKFYVFLTQKDNRKRTGQSGMDRTLHTISLTFTNFCSLFRNRRPAILIDLFKFIFGAQNEDFVEFPQLSKFSNYNEGEITNEKEETLQQKWNNRLKNTNQLLNELLKHSQQL